MTDRDRPLAPRGRKAVPKIAHAMAERGWLPEAVLVSPARRTRQTWDLVAATWVRAPDPSFPETLYPGTAGSLLEALRSLPDGVGSVLLVAHNPAIQDLAHGLAGPSSDAAARAHLEAKYPTAALARFEFDAAWSDLALGEARLTDFVRPKDLD